MSRVEISEISIMFKLENYFTFPACRDGKRISESSLLPGSCADHAMYMCMDRGCEDGPEGVEGWQGACCGGYAFEWIPNVPRPSEFLLT